MKEQSTNPFGYSSTPWTLYGKFAVELVIIDIEDTYEGLVSFFADPSFSISSFQFIQAVLE